MFGTKPQHEFQIWHVKGRSPLVLYSLVAMYRIAEEAVEAYQDGPSGGMDLCGVLYGTVESGEVRISASRPLACEPRMGLEFSLTEADEAGWRASLEEYAYEPDLRGMRPVGWYVTHSRTGISLGEQELRAWNLFFPEKEQIALVVRPHQGRPTRGGFFFRPDGGEPSVNSSLLEFEAGPPQGLRQARFLDPGIGEPPPVELTELPAKATRWGRPAVFAAGILAACAALAYYLVQPGTRVEPDTAVAMHLVESGGQLRAIWDKSAGPVLRAQSAELEVRDGASRLKIPVSAALLRNGSWPIIRTSGDVAVRLQMLPLGEASARFLSAGPVPAAQPADSKNSDKLEAQRAQIEKLQSRLEALGESNNQLEAKAAELQARWNARAAAPVRQPAPAPVPVKPATAAPAVSSSGQVAPPPGQGLFSERIASRGPVPAMPPAEPPKISTYAGPMSGKIIWTGLLPAGGTLTIDGGLASIGNVNGALPGVPVRISAYPAEFSSGGLVVFSGNPKHSRGNVVEPRSAQNGWLETRYLFDAARAREVSIGEAPAPGNQFQHLQIRSTGKAVPVFVIEWEVAQ